MKTKNGDKILTARHPHKRQSSVDLTVLANERIGDLGSKSGPLDP